MRGECLGAKVGQDTHASGGDECLSFSIMSRLCTFDLFAREEVRPQKPKLPKARSV